MVMRYHLGRRNPEALALQCLLLYSLKQSKMICFFMLLLTLDVYIRPKAKILKSRLRVFDRGENLLDW